MRVDTIALRPEWAGPISPAAGRLRAISRSLVRPSLRHRTARTITRRPYRDLEWGVAGHQRRLRSYPSPSNPGPCPCGDRRRRHHCRRRSAAVGSRSRRRQSGAGRDRSEWKARHEGQMAGGGRRAPHPHHRSEPAHMRRGGDYPPGEARRTHSPRRDRRSAVCERLDAPSRRRRRAHALGLHRGEAARPPSFAGGADHHRLGTKRSGAFPHRDARERAAAARSSSFAGWGRRPVRLRFFRLSSTQKLRRAP